MVSAVVKVLDATLRALSKLVRAESLAVVTVRIFSILNLFSALET